MDMCQADAFHASQLSSVDAAVPEAQSAGGWAANSSSAPRTSPMVAMGFQERCVIHAVICDI